MARRLDLPPRHLEPLLQVLMRGGILRGVRGPKGGYELARERRRISVAAILRASLADTDAKAESRPPLVSQVVEPLITDIGTAVLDAFETLTVADLCEKALAATTNAKANAPADFTI